MKNIFILALSVLALASCTTSQLMEKHMRSRTAPLTYLHDTSPSGCEKVAWVKLEQPAYGADLDSLLTVSQVQQLVIPLLFVNYSMRAWEVRLGAQSVTPDYRDFFVESLDKTGRERGCFAWTSDDRRADYTLEISYDSCNVNTYYRRKFFMLFFLSGYSMSWREWCAPLMATLSVTATLKKAGEPVLVQHYDISKAVEPFPMTKNDEANHINILNNLAYALSLSVDECVNSMVDDVNRHVLAEAE